MDDEDERYYDFDTPEDHDPEKEWVLDCGLKNCCMPGYHFRYECHTPEMIEAMVEECEKECSCTFGEGAQFHLPECRMRRAHPTAASTEP